MSKITDINLLIGRIIIGLYFLLPGAIAKIFNYEFIFNYMLDHDVPMTNVALILTIIIQLKRSIGLQVLTFFLNGAHTKTLNIHYVT